MAGPRRRGAFITLEGGEGGGKSTQTKALVARLKRAGVFAIATREPGGSDAAELIRSALLAGRFEQLGMKAEALLFAAARIDHLDRKINPALDAGTWVVCDRFHDSTRVYQGAHGGVDADFLFLLEKVSLDGTWPDLTLILDLPETIGLARADARRQGAADRYERQSPSFHRALRQAFRDLADREPDRCVLIDAAQAADHVEESIWDVVTHRLLLPSRLVG